MLTARSRVIAVPGLVTALVLGLVWALTAPVSADVTAFWGYWQADGAKWAFAQTGPASAHPKDGGVEGWRFAKSSGESGTPPRTAPDFDAICGSTAEKAGSKRVAVVLDYGEAADAPSGATPPAAKTACASVPEKATGSDVLAKVARPQTDKSGLVCAIDAFGTCAVAAPSSSSSPSAAPAARKRSAGSTAVSVVIGVILVLAAGGSMMAVRRRAKL
jgi:hypothetical protein